MVSFSVMNHIFASCVDVIALSGSEGTSFTHVINSVLEPDPDVALVAWVLAQLRNRPALFTSPDFRALPHELHVIACEALRNRALGFNELENSTVMPQSRKILEAIGRAGAKGVLQSDLAELLKISAGTVHHYLITLFSNGLIARKRVVLMRKKKKASCMASSHQDAVEKLPDFDSALNCIAETSEDNKNISKEPGDAPAEVSVTYTSVLVLARYQTLLETSNHTTTFPSLKLGDPVQFPGASTSNSFRLQEVSTALGENNSSVSVFDLANNVPLRRIVEALRSSRVRAERDLKFICLPESEKDPGTTMEVFRYTRHRKFRSVRNRLVRLGIAKVVRRKCHDPSGKFLGKLRCLALAKCAREENVIEGILRDMNHSAGFGKPTSLVQEDNRPKASSCIPQKLHPLLVGYTGPAYEAEVDAVEQVYRLLERAGAEGISVPEIDAYMDGGTGLTGLAQRRIRNLIKIISRKAEVVERQLFEGRIMFIRFALRKFVGDSDGWQGTIDQLGNGEPKVLTPAGKRKKVGVTTLGEQRQKIILDLLRQRTVIAQEFLGREIAEIEGNQVVRIDRKVMDRIIKDLIKKKLVKVITATKPCIKGVRKWDTVHLLTLPHVQESNPEVRKFISSALDRLLYGHTTENKKSDTGVKSTNGNGGGEQDEDSRRDTGGEANIIPDKAHFGNDQNSNRAEERAIGNSSIILPDRRVRARSEKYTGYGDENNEGVECREARVPDSIDDGSDADNESGDDGDVQSDGRDSDDENEVVVVNYEDEALGKAPSCQPSGIFSFSQADPEKRNTSGNTLCQSLHIVKDLTLEASEACNLIEEQPALCSRVSGCSLDPLESSAGNAKGSPSHGSQASRGPEDKSEVRQTGKKRRRLFFQEPPAAGHNDIEAQVTSVGPSGQRTIRVETDFRDSRKSRIGKLQAIDYGWMKGSMARARLFHKLLFKYVLADRPECKSLESNPVSDTCEGEKVPLSEVGKFPTVGKFTIFSYLRDMTVEEYAAAVGICNNYGNLIGTIKKYHIEDVMDLLKGELNSAYAARRIKTLIHFLSKLGLIKPKDGSSWTLSGAGAIRDFGRGLPPGVEPHVIPFSARSHVDTYWRELRRFSQFRLLSSGAKLTDTRKAVQGSGGWELRDIYAVSAWDTGMVHEFSLYEQLIFECILQRLCGVDVPLTSLDLSGSNVVCSPLRAFSVEELVDELDYVASSNPYIGRHRGNVNISEGLLGYARMRTTEEIPKIVRNMEEGFSRKLQSVLRPKDIPASHKVSVLRVKRTVRGMKGERITEDNGLSETKQKKQGKSLLKKQLKIDVSPVVEVTLDEIFPMLREILCVGSIAYCAGDVELPDWRVVAAQWLEKKTCSPGADGAFPQEQCRAVSAFSQCLLFRLGFDVLSLQLVLRVEKLSFEEDRNSLKSLSTEKVEALTDRAVTCWQNLDDIIRGLMIEVLNEVEQEWRVKVTLQQLYADGYLGGKSVLSSQRKVLEDYFSSRYRSHHVHQSFSVLLTLSSARCRRIASLRAKENVFLGVLLGVDQEREDQCVDLELCPQHSESLTGLKIGATESGLQQAVFSKDDVSRSLGLDKNISKLNNENVQTSEESGMDPIRSNVRDNFVSTPVRVELAEIIVCAVLRQDRNEQRSANSRKLLERFDVQSISLARDRLLITEVVVTLEGHDRNREHLSVAKGERGSDPLIFLSEVDGEGLGQNWIEDLIRTRSENGSPEVDISETAIFDDIRSITPASTFAANMMTRLSIFDNGAFTFDMGVFFVGDDEQDKNHCIVKLNCVKKASKSSEPVKLNSSKNTARYRVDEDMNKVMKLSQFITQLLDRSGWQGVMIHDLLKQAEESGHAVIGNGNTFIRTLDNMVRGNNIYRFAVEAENKEWNVNDGGLFLSPRYGRTMQSTEGLLTAWTDVSGRTDVALVRESASAVLETVMKRPGIDVVDATSEVSGRFPWIPRRALADLLFGLVRSGFIQMNAITKKGTRWVDLNHSDPIRNIDEVSIITWRRHVKVTLKPIPERIQGGKMWAGTDQHVAELVIAYTE